MSAEAPVPNPNPQEKTEKELLKEKKKLEKEAEKNAKKDKKLAAQQEREQSRLNQLEEEKAAFQLSLDDLLNHTKTFGQWPLIKSQVAVEAIVGKDGKKSITGFEYLEVAKIDASHVGKTFAFRARVHTVRGKGKTVFVVLRDQYDLVQCSGFASETISVDMIKWMQKFLTKESIIEIVGKVVKPEQPILSSTKPDIEISVEQCFLVSEALSPLPILIEEIMKDDTAVGQDLRLDNRVIDMRAPPQMGIFRISSGVGRFFREYLYSQDFTEIHTPKMIGSASEGGSEVFEVKYFDTKAYLAQSPQLYKQMCICGDMKRVFEVGPVFRAEKSFTQRHMTEFSGLDIEMEIKYNYHELLEVVNDLFVYIFDNLNKFHKKDLEAIRQYFPFQDLVYQRKNLILKFSEGIKMLKEAGVQIGELDDLSTEQERMLGKLVKEKYNTDFYILEGFPTKVRAFYTMPSVENPDYSNSFDVFIRGQEVTSGAQRIHDHLMLEQAVIKKGIDPKSLAHYIGAMKYGASPHGGAGIGLERVTMLFIDQNNIRKSALFPRDPVRLFP